MERVCRDSIVYDPQEVNQFLIEAKLPDPRPLIHVCDRFDFVEGAKIYKIIKIQIGDQGKILMNLMVEERRIEMKDDRGFTKR